MTNKKKTYLIPKSITRGLNEPQRLKRFHDPRSFVILFDFRFGYTWPAEDDVAAWWMELERRWHKRT